MSNYLVSTDWLANHLSDPNLRIFDCAGLLGKDFVNQAREQHYNLHHIPGAAFLDVASPKGELTNPDGALPFTWPTQSQFESAMGRLGVDNNCRVILYGVPTDNVPGGGTVWATRAWWLMHHFGVDVAMLDGGWSKWTREKRPQSNAPHAYPATTFKAKPGWERGLAKKDDVLTAVNTKTACVLDSLSPESFRGEVDRNYGTFGSRKGHITGAVNVNYEGVTDPQTGCFLPPETLREKFKSGGVPAQGKVITYCGGGIGATATGFALKLIGREDVALYDGSLMEWANDPSLPMTDMTQGAS